MTPKALEEIEKKYKEYLPMPSAKRILELIAYCRELEKKVKEREVCAVRQNQELMEMNEVLREQNEAMNKSTIALRKQALTCQKAVEAMEKINLAVEFCPTDDHLVATITSLSNQYQEAVCRKAEVKE